MVKISNCCQCCDSKAEKDEIKRRALNSVQMLYSTEGKSYYPDGAGTVTVPLPTPEDLIQLRTDKESISQLGEDIERLEGVDTGLRTDLETLKSKEAADVAELKTADVGLSERVSDNADQIAATASDLQATEAAVAANQSKIADVEAKSAAIAKSLVSDVIMSDGTTAGSVQVSIEREDGALITSKNYAWGKSVGCRLEAGTQEGYIKTLIDLSDGTVIESNEYKIVEVLESDVYVTAITLVPNPAAGTIGGTISYSNGTTQSINAVSVPTAPGVTSAIEALQTRMTSAEQKNTQQDASLQSLNSRVKAIEDTPGVGQFGAGKLGTIAGSAVEGRIKAEDDGTGSVNGWNTIKTDARTLKTDVGTLKTDVSQLKISDAEHTETLATQAAQISAQANEISEIKSTQAQHTNQIRECIDEVTLGADGSSLDFTTVGGQTSNIKVSSEAWIKITDFSHIDISRIQLGTQIRFKKISVQSEELANANSGFGVCTSIESDGPHFSLNGSFNNLDKYYPVTDGYIYKLSGVVTGLIVHYFSSLGSQNNGNVTYISSEAEFYIKY